MVEQSRSRRVGRARRKLVPPVPMWPRSIAAILHEVSGPVGVTLWQCARDVRLWTAAAEEQRPHLFRGGFDQRITAIAGDVPEMAVAVGRVADLVRAPAPGSEEIALAAFEVSRWAESRNLHTTALEFAEAAAVADAGSADYALAAGRLARYAGEINRAVAWYARAVALSRENHDAYIRSQLGYGELMHQVGHVGIARQALRRASRLAIKYGRRGLAAQANHQLLLTSSAAGAFDEGVAAAANALERYPVRHPRLPELALAFAGLLIQEGYFASAVQVLQECVATVNGGEQAVVHGMLARSYGALGDGPRFDASRDAVLSAAEANEGFARGLVHAAAGAIALGDRDDLAACLAAEAVAAAQEIGASAIQMDAADLLEDVARGRDRQSQPAREAPLSLQLLVTGFVRRLEKRAQTAVPRDEGEGDTA
jgi:tetratricopeptide (TPR) repeat protein